MMGAPAVGIDRYDGSDALGRGDLARVDHDQQLHQVVVHLPATTLEVEKLKVKFIRWW